LIGWLFLERNLKNKNFTTVKINLMAIRKLKLGTRGSLLALRQAEEVKEKIEKRYPEIKIEIVKIKTQGDKNKKENRPPSFVKEIEEALLKEEIDIAVHSMKDIPTNIPKGLSIAAITERMDPRDVLVSKRGNLDKLPLNSILGTSSLRRKAQILNFRKDFIIKDIRGNVDTRLKKLEDGAYDAIILAAAGLIRLGWEDKITEFISDEILLPAPGQGALGIEIRKDDTGIKDLVSFLNHENSFCAVSVERSFLKGIGEGCNTPIAAYCKINNERIKLTGIVATENGEKVIRDSIESEKMLYEEIGPELAKRILNRGGKKILEKYKIQ